METSSNHVVEVEEEISPEEKELTLEIEKIKEQLDIARRAVQDTDYFKMTEHVKELGRIKFKVRKQLHGHLSKITGICWAQDSQLLVSASQDGKLFIWDTHTANKIHMIPLEIPWVIGCGISPNMKLVSSGGLDNVISIFNIVNIDSLSKPIVELKDHKGYISNCKFPSDTTLISSSGDKNCILWDISAGGKAVSYFLGHQNDVTAIALSSSRSDMFVSVSSDKSCRLWDIRTQRCCQIFEGHTEDVNGVEFFPKDTFGFVTSSDDGTCRLWDARADQSIAVYTDDYITCGSTSVSLSKSGRLLIAGYDDYNCHVWDVLREERVGIMSAHDGRVSCVSVSPNGVGIATGSWDSSCLIWTSKPSQ